MKKQQDLHKQKRVRMLSVERRKYTDAVRSIEGTSLTVLVCVTPKYAPFLCVGSRA